MIPIRLLQWFFILLVFVVLAVPVRADNPAGLITKVQGRVTVRLTGEEKTTPVKAGDSVSVGHLIQTGLGSKVQLVFTDHSLITILPESGLRINQYAYSTDNNVKILRKDQKAYSFENIRVTAVIQLLTGRARFFVPTEKRNYDSKITILTGQASISTRISDFMVNASPAETEVAVLGDPLTVKNISSFIVGEVDLDINQKTVVRGKTPPAQPTIFTSEQRRKYISDATF